MVTNPIDANFVILLNSQQQHTLIYNKKLLFPPSANKKDMVSLFRGGAVVENWKAQGVHAMQVCNPRPPPAAFGGCRRRPGSGGHFLLAQSARAAANPGAVSAGESRRPSVRGVICPCSAPVLSPLWNPTRPYRAAFRLRKDSSTVYRIRTVDK